MEHYGIDAMNHYLTKAISPYRTNIYLSYDQYSYSIEMFLYYNCNLMEQFDWINYCLIRVRMFYCILINSWQPLRHGSAQSQLTMFIVGSVFDVWWCGEVWINLLPKSSIKKSDMCI